MDGMIRCSWVPAGDVLYTEYHDKEWGVPVHDDQKLFEFLILEGFQAGLSWGTILRKRAGFRKSFDNFAPAKVALFDEKKVGELRNDVGIVRNEAKIRAAIKNAKAFLEIQKEFGSFDSYMWAFVGNRPRINRRRSLAEIPPSTKEAEDLSSDLIQRGFKFVGPTICYAHMQATGMVNDHVVSCFRYDQLSSNSE